MALFERTRMDDKYRRAMTATILTYITTAKEIGKDPLRLSNLPLAASIVTGRELSLRLGKTVHKEKDSLFWVSVDPTTGKITGYKFLAPDFSKFRSKLNKQLKEWGKKSEIKKLMSKRAVAVGIVAGVVTAAIITTVVVVVTAGAAAPAAAAATAALTSSGGAGAGGAAAGGAVAATAATTTATTAGSVTVGGAVAAGGGSAATTTIGKVGLDLALKGLTSAAKRGGSIEDMANAAKGALPPGQAAALEQEAQQTAKEVESEDNTLVYVGIGAAGLFGVGILAYLLTRGK